MITKIRLSLTKNDAAIRQWILFIDESRCIVPDNERAADLALSDLFSGSDIADLDTRAATTYITDTVTRGFSGLPGLVPAGALAFAEIANGMNIKTDANLDIPTDAPNWTIFGASTFSLLQENKQNSMILSPLQRLHPLARRNMIPRRPSFAGEPCTLSTVMGFRSSVFTEQGHHAQATRESLAFAIGLIEGLRMDQGNPRALEGVAYTTPWTLARRVATRLHPVAETFDSSFWGSLISRGILGTNRAWGPTFLSTGVAFVNTRDAIEDLNDPALIALRETGKQIGDILMWAQNDQLPLIRLWLMDADKRQAYRDENPGCLELDNAKTLADSLLAL